MEASPDLDSHRPYILISAPSDTEISLSPHLAEDTPVTEHISSVNPEQQLLQVPTLRRRKMSDIEQSNTSATGAEIQPAPDSRGHLSRRPTSLADMKVTFGLNSNTIDPQPSTPRPRAVSQTVQAGLLRAIKNTLTNALKLFGLTDMEYNDARPQAEPSRHAFIMGMTFLPGVIYLIYHVIGMVVSLKACPAKCAAPAMDTTPTMYATPAIPPMALASYTKPALAISCLKSTPTLLDGPLVTLKRTTFV